MIPRSNGVPDIDPFLFGGVAGGVRGRRGEKGDGGIATLEDLRGLVAVSRSRCIFVVVCHVAFSIECHS